MREPARSGKYTGSAGLAPVEGRGRSGRTGDEAAYEQAFLVLAGIFIAALVACNLVFQKFFAWELALGAWRVRFEQSVGILAYPVTFLVTDILSEVYGRRRAAQVVTAGLAASLFVLLLVLAGHLAPAAPWSPVDDGTFARVFGFSWIGVTASLLAYLGAQYLDIRLFHFWRRLTRGRHLWLRNNASTITSQVVDTALVNGLLVVFGAPGLDWSVFPTLFWNGVLFKWLVALADTPLFYGAVFLFRRRFADRVDAVAREELGLAGAEAPESVLAPAGEVEGPAGS